MNASPRRCRSGPQNRIGIRLDPACASMSATCARSTLLGSRSSTPSRGLASVTWTPCSSSRPVTTVTSRICGTFSRRLGSPPSRAATIALETKFLAPRTVIVPVRGVPPWTVRASVTATILDYDGRPARQGTMRTPAWRRIRACRALAGPERFRTSTGRPQARPCPVRCSSRAASPEPATPVAVVSASACSGCRCPWAPGTGPAGSTRPASPVVVVSVGVGEAGGVGVGGVGGVGVGTGVVDFAVVFFAVAVFAAWSSSPSSTSRWSSSPPPCSRRPSSRDSPPPRSASPSTSRRSPAPSGWPSWPSWPSWLPSSLPSSSPAARSRPVRRRTRHP